ncbi:MAG TPA: CBS domain-containing protein [Gemmatimonadaceae bacterium]
MPTRGTITRVNDIMSSAPKSVYTSTTIEQLLELFDRHDFNAFPVTNAANELVGIVTKVDLLRALRPTEEHKVREGTRTPEMSVGEIMRANVISVDAEAPINVAADAMVETGLRSIPVVLNRGGRPELVGMVSRGDVIRGFRLALRDDK